MRNDGEAVGKRYNKKLVWGKRLCLVPAKNQVTKSFWGGRQASEGEPNAMRQAISGLCGNCCSMSKTAEKVSGKLLWMVTEAEVIETSDVPQGHISRGFSRPRPKNASSLMFLVAHLNRKFGESAEQLGYRRT